MGATVQELPYIVDEFPDIFLDELSGMPPDREVEFSINLLSRMSPIFTPSYRMAPTELTEHHMKL